jgi:hypothetical protein
MELLPPFLSNEPATGLRKAVLKMEKGSLHVVFANKINSNSFYVFLRRRI